MLPVQSGAVEQGPAQSQNYHAEILLVKVAASTEEPLQSKASSILTAPDTPKDEGMTLKRVSGPYTISGL